MLIRDPVRDPPLLLISEVDQWRGMRSQVVTILAAYVAANERDRSKWSSPIRVHRDFIGFRVVRTVKEGT